MSSQPLGRRRRRLPMGELTLSSVPSLLTWNSWRFLSRERPLPRGLDEARKSTIPFTWMWKTTRRTWVSPTVSGTRLIPLLNVGMGITRTLLSPKLVEKAPMVYYHGVTGKAASKHWRSAWVTDTGADPDDDAAADVSEQCGEYCRKNTPEQISLDLGTLCKHCKLMQHLPFSAPRYRTLGERGSAGRLGDRR